MNKKSLEKQLLKKVDSEVLVNFHMDAKKHEKLKAKLKKQNLKLKEFFNAAANVFLSEE